MINPDELSLYIQPSEELAEYAWQDYSTKDLKSLWINILSSIDEVPIEIKAEELKNSFLMNQSQINSNSVLPNDYIIFDDSDVEDVLNNPNVKQIIETFSKPENQKIIELLIDPGIQDAAKQITRLKTYYDKMSDNKRAGD